jgi:hypothetical protein
MMQNEPTLEISPDMTILEIVGRYPATESVFKKYDRSAGVCLCCQALFEPLRDIADNYGLDLNLLIDDLMAAATDKSHNMQ